jgi:hypothetical protein
MLKLSSLLSLVILIGPNILSCQRTSERKEQISPLVLRHSSLRFVRQTKLLEASGGSAGGGAGGFEPSTFPTSGFWPSTPLVVPARAAAFINETYGASGGFAYQSFEFTSTGCQASQAFARYFGAIEQLRGTPLSQGEKDQIENAFQSAFMEAESGLPDASACLFFDLMACIADYSIHNEAIFKQAAQSGDFTVIMTGAVSCIAEITGMDPTDTIDPFDPGTTDPDE